MTGKISKDDFRFRWSRNSVIAYNLGKSFFSFDVQPSKLEIVLGLGR